MFALLLVFGSNVGSLITIDHLSLSRPMDGRRRMFLKWYLKCRSFRWVGVYWEHERHMSYGHRHVGKQSRQNYHEIAVRLFRMMDLLSLIHSRRFRPSMISLMILLNYEHDFDSVFRIRKSVGIGLFSLWTRVDFIPKISSVDSFPKNTGWAFSKGASPPI